MYVKPLDRQRVKKKKSLSSQYAGSLVRTSEHVGGHEFNDSERTIHDLVERLEDRNADFKNAQTKWNGLVARMAPGPERDAVAQNVVHMIADLQEIINNETSRVHRMMDTHRYNPEETIHTDGHHPTQTAMTQHEFDHMYSDLVEKKNDRIVSMSDDALAAENNNFEVNMALFLRNYQKQIHQMMHHNPHYDDLDHHKLAHGHPHHLDHHDSDHHHHHLGHHDLNHHDHHNLHQNHQNSHQNHVQSPQHFHDPNQHHNDHHNSQNDIHNSANASNNTHNH